MIEQTYEFPTALAGHLAGSDVDLDPMVDLLLALS